MAMSRKSTRRRRRTGAEIIAGLHVPVVLAESTRLAIDKIATEMVQEMFADGTFRQELRALVRRDWPKVERQIRGPRKKARGHT
jgi:hypothetical protein